MKSSAMLGVLAILAFVSPATAQSINIDFGPPGSGPSSGYRAAGIHGFWHSFEAIDPVITYDLVDVHGKPTDATVGQFGGTEIVQGSIGRLGQPGGEDWVLLGDAMVTHTNIESCLFFNGLKNGTYEVTTYAWMPTSVEVSVSLDGEQFREVARLVGDVPDDRQGVIYRDIATDFEEVEARYVRVVARSYGTIPDWHPGRGGAAWIFVDEILVD
jgi:hypothetical protein